MHIPCQRGALPRRRSPFENSIWRAFSFCSLIVCAWSLDCAAQYGNPRFSPSEDYLAIDFCLPKCRFIIYSLKTGTSTTFDAPKEERWINPAFDSQGNQLTFVVVRDPADTQIAAIRLDGTNFRKLTTSPVIKRSPSFSPDGKQIVFAGGSKTVTERGSFSSVDLYVIDLGTREERRVTDLKVVDIGDPFFLPDGKKIAFHTVGSAIPRKEPRRQIPLNAMYPDRTVFVQAPNENAELEPILQVPLIASAPAPIATGEVALLVRVNSIDSVKWPYVYDIFLAKNGTATRLTKFQTYVLSYGISNSGDMVAFVADVPGKERKENRVMLWRKSTGKAVEIKFLPAKSISPRSN